jgi:arabinogalactan endo-1,4-beta-galactosidase
MRTATRLRAALAAGLLAAALLTAPPVPATAAGHLSMLGADVSSLQRTLDLGGRYYAPNGAAADPLDILRAAGVNYGRLRVWNNPASGYNNRAKVLVQARALKAKGLKTLIDLHYSDTWADPGKQVKPAAWSSHTLSQLQRDVYDYTYDVCTALKAQGTTPDSIQIGNEINVGMLWPEGRVTNNNFAPLASLLRQGYQAAKACSSTIQVLIHTADADSMANARWFYDGIRAQGVQWDITALSYYCMWHGTLTNLSNVITDMRNRYGKPVVIAETAYQFTTADADGQPNSINGRTLCDGVPASWSGQAQQFAMVQNTARNAGAIGVFYWEPTWYAINGNGWDPANMNGTGDGWDNMAVFDWTGHLNPNIRWTP